MPIVLKSGGLNLLEPSGPVQACNGTALPFTVLAINGFIGKDDENTEGVVIRNLAFTTTPSASAFIA